MIAFATLWLGLVTGNVPVELLVGAEVARVEVRLDGEICSTLSEPPWSASCELGEELAPHELVALAFDAEERSVGEARQWLNLPREAAELEVAIARKVGPPPRLVARLAWAGPGGAAPTAVRATLDGEALAISTDSTGFTLPAPAAGAAKLLRVEAAFPGGATAVRELAVGGDVAEQITQELTGVPVEAIGRDAPRALSDGERELPIVAIEQGEADLVAVLDPSALAGLDELARTGGRQRLARGGIGIGVGASPGSRAVSVDERAHVPLPEGARLRLVWPIAASRRQGELRYDLFATSPERTAADGSLLAQLRLAAMLPPSSESPRLADAVALAALTAAQPGRRRAVLLVVGGGTTDASLHDAARVRRFLDRLRVPLVVWSTTAATANAAATWGEVETVTSVPRLEAAASRLDALLGRQRIAWVEGRHLPQRLVPADRRLRMATSEAEAPRDGEPEGRARRGDDRGATTGNANDIATAADVEAVGDNSSRGAGDALADDAAPGDVDVETGVASGGELTDFAGAPGDAPAAPPQLPAGLPLRPLPPFSLATDVRDERLLGIVGAAAAALPVDFEARFGLRVVPQGTLVLFARTADFRSWLAAEGGGDLAVDGFARHGVAALAVEHQKSEEVTALMVHELSHLLVRVATGRQLPAWLEEGLPEELAIGRRDGRGHTVPGSLRIRTSTRGVGGPARVRSAYERTIVGPAAALIALVRGPRPPLSELLAMPWETFTAASGRPDRYAAAAFFVRFLLDGEDRRRREPFRAFLANVAAGGPADAKALEAALGVELPRLQSRFDAWLRRTAQTLR
ncbi:MAG TPA: hypothetical protein VN811_13980 [Thermoanaerobaculia bacterium]|nr:hypothetical protein [Thermoanaerobaculia bacterium]